MTTPDPLIYQIREALKQSASAISAGHREALRNARLRAVSRAEEKHSHRGPVASRRTPSAAKAWGMAITLASLATVVIGLQLAQRHAVDQDILRLAEIDKRVITGALPPQAYLDPGFLAFQEETLNDEQITGLTAGVTLRANTAAQSVSTSAALKHYWQPELFFPGLESTPTRLTWARLTGPQREALAPLEPYWAELDDARKRKWIKIADRFPTLDASEQARAQERMEAWVALPAVERRQARSVYRSVTKAIPEDVRVMKWNEYQALSEKERTRLFELAQQKVAEATGSPEPLVVGPRRPANALATKAEKPLAAQ